ncbi:MAG: phenylalanine--tRNA ligase subunit alpha [Prochlorotrichaceae cyanobacterium]
MLNLSPQQKHFLQRLRHCQRIPSLRQFADQEQFEFNFLKGLLSSGLVDAYLSVRALEERTSQWQLTPKGEGVSPQLPGVALAQLLLQGQTDAAQLQQALGEAFSPEYAGLKNLRAIDWHRGEEGKRIQILSVEALEALQARQQVFRSLCESLSEQTQGKQPSVSVLDSPHLEALVEQGFAVAVKGDDYEVQALPALDRLDLKPMVTTLTSDLLLSGRWREVDLKPYAVEDEAPYIPYGRATLLTRCIERVRDIFLNMGFDEMSGSILESAFWNFDVLFTPQDHPAREIQDTFYIDRPAEIPLPDDRDLVEQVQAVHDRSYGGQWSEQEASRAIFRAQTTTFTARKLAELKGETGKFFSIDKVFRNETSDRTHLHEFYQIEGVVIGELLSVRSLMGYLTYFYQRLGFENLKFKPTYNPYTEPSLEVYAYHEPSQKYLEVGNSGLFRPEMLTPLGCSGCSTIAWGLGLERIALLLYGSDKLSDLVGPDMGLD